MTQEPDKALDALDVLRRLVEGRCVSRADNLEQLVCNEITSLRAEVERCHARLEINEASRMKADGSLERFTIPPEKRLSWPDGIECRNDTIELQDEQIASLRSTVSRLTAELEAARETLNTVHGWLVCSAIATPEDMSESFEYMEQVCAKVLSDVSESAAHTLEKKL